MTSGIETIARHQQNRINALEGLKMALHQMLEDDARIEELQGHYKDLASETLAMVLCQGVEMRRAKMPQKILSLQDRVCDLAEQVYRLVK